MLPFDFINGERRAAFASQPEAEAAANEAHRGDLRPRAVWLCSGGEAWASKKAAKVDDILAKLEAMQ